eukprot:s6250_g4.t1
MTLKVFPEFSSSLNCCLAVNSGISITTHVLRKDLESSSLPISHGRSIREKTCYGSNGVKVVTVLGKSQNSKCNYPESDISTVRTSRGIGTENVRLATQLLVLRPQTLSKLRLGPTGTRLLNKLSWKKASFPKCFRGPLGLKVKPVTRQLFVSGPPVGTIQQDMTPRGRNFAQGTNLKAAITCKQHRSLPKGLEPLGGPVAFV